MKPDLIVRKRLEVRLVLVEAPRIAFRAEAYRFSFSGEQLREVLFSR